MLNLVKKDLKLSKKINIFAAIYALFISAMGLSVSQDILSNVLYILGMIILIFVSVIYTNGYDDKYKSEIALNSLPIDRRNIVRGKYISLIIYIIISCGSVFIFTNLIRMMNIVQSGEGASLWNIIIATNIALIFYSLYYPFYFKLGDGLRNFNTILWILMTVGPTIASKSVGYLMKLGYLEKLMNIDINRINIYLLVFSIAIYYISLQISKKIYLKREFY